MKKPYKMINHYSKWQYLVIIFTVVMLGLNALPNWFGEQAALHIQTISNQPLILDSAKIYNTLTKQGIHVDLIEQQNDKNIVLLHDKMQQQQARNLDEHT
jgi:preprotein translocase subunit SecD